VETRRENKSEGHTEDTNDLIASLEELSLNLRTIRWIFWKRSKKKKKLRKKKKA
jgi:hypothetical protein